MDLGTVPTVWYFCFVFHFISMIITKEGRKKNEALQIDKKQKTNKQRKTGRSGYIEIEIKLYLLL